MQYDNEKFFGKDTENYSVVLKTRADQVHNFKRAA